MARKPQPAAPAPDMTDAPDAPQTDTGMVTVFGSEIEYNGAKLAVPAFDVPADFAPALKYLVQYGFNQSLQDCVSGMAKEMRDENAAKDEDERLADDELDAAIKAAVTTAQTERRDAILSGNVTARGPRLPTVDRLVRDMALAYLKAFAKKKGQKLPKRPKDAAKGSPNVALNAMIDAAIASPLGAKWRAEAEKQIAALSAIDTATADFDPFAAKPAAPAAAA